MANPRNFRERLILWLAEGFGIGRVPFAPGTFGTLLGFVWIWALMLSGSRLLYAGGVLAGYFLAVWIGTQAERITGEKDPGRFVLDEIAAMPLAFLPVILAGPAQIEFNALLSIRNGWVFAACFAFFRIFDIGKPWPIGGSQRLPSGWGFVTDDMLAALYAAAVLWLLILWVPFPA